MKNLTAAHSRKVADHIVVARKAGDRLVSESEKLREAIDELDSALGKLAGLSVQLAKRERIEERLVMIRRARNGMECFALNCWLSESLTAAWRELP